MIDLVHLCRFRMYLYKFLSTDQGVPPDLEVYVPEPTSSVQVLP